MTFDKAQINGYTDIQLERVIKNAVHDALVNVLPPLVEHIENQIKSESTINQNDDRLILTPNEIATALGLSRPSVYALMNREDFPTIRMGKKLVVGRRALQDWLMSRRVVDETC